MAFIEMNHVSFTYPTSQSVALSNLHFQVEKGQFVVLFGASGSGKSTLLRLLKKEIQPHGKLDGEIFINGLNLKGDGQHSGSIGFVFQDPENQVIAEDVLDELVFGLENIGLSTNEMRSRVAEMVHFFGAESLLHRKTNELSGGKKQQINLASVLLMQPEILLLDEPTAQLDPVSAREFLDMLVRLNEEFGMTIILAEHRLDEVFTIADKIVMMENGKIIADGEPQKVMESIWNSRQHAFVPSIPSLYLSSTKKDADKKVPLSVKDGRNWIREKTLQKQNQGNQEVWKQSTQKVLDVKDIYYRYSKEDDFVLKDFQFSLMQGEIYALLGGNGSGKSTFLKLLTGIHKPTQGKLFLHNQPLKSWGKNELSRRIGYLPQNPKIFFIHDTVEKEIEETMNRWGITSQQEVDLLLNQLGIAHLRKSHPYDLSGGELQKAALACLLLRKPEVLLLDEPTKGLDPISKENFAEILLELKESGMTILMSTHDVEFAAQYATKCGMMFQGNITSENSPRKFFKGNFFYTTMVQRLFRNHPDVDIVTFEEARLLCGIEQK
ncbi:ABC transporter ATP-binding protein [Bacillus sp. CGMCC 1.16607]|uniref:ABC transporter ATP-binding protein n=1 Tax=Bacillus sp. CGMCC 1.16607 TaxID=3351842 RepID=UPI00362CBC7B